MNAIPQSGFTLAEVLVSIIVLAIGILGTARTQLAAFQTSQQSAFHGAATQIATSIAEKLHANDRQASAPFDPYLAVDYRAESDPAPGSSSECFRSDCSPAGMAEFDIDHWKARVRNELPGGRLRICRDSQPWDDAEKTYRWECSASGSDRDGMVIKLGWQEKRDIHHPDPEKADRDRAPLVVMTIKPRTR